MATKAYLMVTVDEKFCQSGYQDILRDLEAIPDVQSVERVSGACNLLVKVDAPISRKVFVANEIMVKEWAKNLHILHVEPIQLDELKGLTADELIRLKRVIPAEEGR